MTLPIEVDDSAASDLLEAALVYEEAQEGLGEQFTAVFERTAARIAEAPRASPRVPDFEDPEIEVREARLRRFPYKLISVVEPDRVVLFAVAHERRHPRYWAKRLEK